MKTTEIYNQAYLASKKENKTSPVELGSPIKGRVKEKEIETGT
jgi:hypothetical protein